MKKALLLLIPLMIFISCEDEKEETPDDTTPVSLVGDWTIESATIYENDDCSGEGEELDATGNITFSETGEASLTVNQTLSFSSFCEDMEGEMIGDTTCSVYDGYYQITISDFEMMCDYEDGELDDDNNCAFTWVEEYDYTYDILTGEYCEIYYAATDSSETDCGTAVVTENSATLQLPEEDGDECFSIVLSR
jgi:hypothetical protein